MQFSYLAMRNHSQRDDSRLHLPPLLPPSMMVDPATVGLVVANFLAWGHWPICAKLGSAPPQPFGVLMVLAQAASAWLACLAHGAEFVDALVQDSASPLAIFCVVSGGAVSCHRTELQLSLFPIHIPRCLSSPRCLLWATSVPSLLPSASALQLVGLSASLVC